MKPARGGDGERKRPIPVGKLLRSIEHRRRPRPKPDFVKARAEERGEGKRQVLTVSEAAARVRVVVEEAFPPLWIVGEVSNKRRPRSGHLYFTLKDDKAVLHAVMFRGAIASGLSFEVEDGLEVLVRGKLSTYERGSEVQVIAERIEPHGQGALELELAALRKRFQAAGFFDPARKKPLPRYPRRIGVVTSPTGAAVRDILTTLERRWPWLDIIISPARVQGRGAADQIARGIDALVALEPRPELILLARGGGAVEDLWAFNLAPVIEAMARCPVPIITGVGHEVDETLADLAADLRMPTPTGAAEAAAPEGRELLAQLGEARERLRRALRLRLQVAKDRVEEAERRLSPRLLQRRLRDEGRRLAEMRERLDSEARDRLGRARERLSRLAEAYGFRAIAERLEQRRRDLAALGRRLDQALAGRVQDGRARLSAVSGERLEAAARARLQRARERLGREASRLDALNPSDVLSRGYAIALKDGVVVRDPAELAPGDRLELRLGGGSIEVEVPDDQPGGAR